MSKSPIPDEEPVMTKSEAKPAIAGELASNNNSAAPVPSDFINVEIMANPLGCTARTQMSLSPSGISTDRTSGFALAKLVEQSERRCLSAAGSSAISALTADTAAYRTELPQPFHEASHLCAWLGETRDEGDKLALAVRVRLLINSLELIAAVL
jgi:hypothetical protein